MGCQLILLLQHGDLARLARVMAKPYQQFPTDDHDIKGRGIIPFLNEINQMYADRWN
jgi:hypothetical protein